MASSDLIADERAGDFGEWERRCRISFQEEARSFQLGKPFGASSWKGRDLRHAERRLPTDAGFCTGRSSYGGHLRR
jgi:hypothetical protein